jgi:multiple sugar transport system substrate-binding protein
MDLKKIIIVLAVILVVLAVAAYFIIRTFYGGLGPVKLEYWGLWEPEGVYQGVIDDYHRLHPNVTINYKRYSSIQYRERLSADLVAGKAPDIFRYHNTWVPMLMPYLSAVPPSAYTQANFRQVFYPVATESLLVKNQLWGIPLEVDTLLLFVNNGIFSQAGVTPPVYWTGEFEDTARRLTVRAGDRIERAGVALGNAGNITHWQDILGLMLVQNEVELPVLTSERTSDVLKYYTGFESLDRVWDQTQDESKLAFARGKLAMYFGYHWDYFDITEMSKGTNLSFKVVPVPQLVDGNVNYASFWVEGVAKNSKHQKEAWGFIKFLSEPKQLTRMYEEAGKLRGFGEPYPRVDMASLMADHPVLSVVAKQAPTAKSWYLASLTWDGQSGINSRIGTYFGDAVNAVARSGEAKSALSTANLGVAQVLSEYGLVPPPVTK